MALRCHHLPMASAIFYLQLSAMDVSVRTTMKGAAKCDKHCELQNSVNRQGLERILCFWDIPESMPASVSMLCCSSSTAIVLQHAAASACASRCAFGTPEASSGQGYATTASLLSISVCPMFAACVVAASCALFGFVAVFGGQLLRHEVRLTNPLNLSI